MRSTSFVRTVLALTSATALCLTLLSAPTAAAPAPAPAAQQKRAAKCFPGCWGAISFNTRTGVSGGVNNLNGKAAAIDRALRRCRNKAANANARQACVSPAPRKVYVQNGCLEVWYRSRNGHIVEWARGSAFFERKAIRIAKRQLDGPGELIRSAHLCTTRRGDYPTNP